MTLAGRVHVNPTGTVSVKVTVPVNPFRAVTVIVEVPGDPADICGLGVTAPADIEKSEGALTVRDIVVV